MCLQVELQAGSRDSRQLHSGTGPITLKVRLSLAPVPWYLGCARLPSARTEQGPLSW